MISIRNINAYTLKKILEFKLKPFQEHFVYTSEEINITRKIHPEWHIKVIKNDNKVIGSTVVEYNKSEKFAMVNQFLINEDYQGKGFGKKSLKQLINYLKKIRKIKEIRLFVVLENKIAINLYESLGFRKTGFYSEDEYGKMELMILSLKNKIKNYSNNID